MRTSRLVVRLRRASLGGRSRARNQRLLHRWQTTVQLDPRLAAKGESPYARSNRLTPLSGRRTIGRIHSMSLRTQTHTCRFPLLVFVRASSLHVGAAAAAAALRKDLVETGRLASGAFDEAYAVARRPTQAR